MNVFHWGDNSGTIFSNAQRSWSLCLIGYMKSNMTSYLQPIWNRLVRRYRLKNLSNDSERRVMRRDTELYRRKGREWHSVTVLRYELIYHKELRYIDFQEQIAIRSFRGSRHTSDRVREIEEHFAVNDTGSIRRMYRHEGTRVIAVRTLSLRNYYMIEDEQVARFIMMTDEKLAWLRNIPVHYYPISNKVLKTLDSIDAMLEHHAGPGVVIPGRLRKALPLGELLTLVRVVPGSYLNALAVALKQQAKNTSRPVVAERLVLGYYKNRIKDPDANLFHVVYSYISACRYTETKLNMRLRSVNRLMAEREAVWRKRDLRRHPEIRTRKKLVLPQQDYGSIHLELINNKKRLLQEARMLNNCVDTYAGDITEGRCAIYHVTYKGGHYTMEIRENEAGRLRVNQLLGAQNAPAPAALSSAMRKILNSKTNLVI